MLGMYCEIVKMSKCQHVLKSTSVCWATNRFSFGHAWQLCWQLREGSKTIVQHQWAYSWPLRTPKEVKTTISLSQLWYKRNNVLIYPCLDVNLVDALSFCQVLIKFFNVINCQLDTVQNGIAEKLCTLVSKLSKLFIQLGWEIANDSQNNIA